MIAANPVNGRGPRQPSEEWLIGQWWMIELGYQQHKGASSADHHQTLQLLGFHHHGTLMRATRLL
ncbi:MAG: hypothetical protein ACR2NR_07835 [Solirubrobacteraceae bacterium]